MTTSIRSIREDVQAVSHRVASLESADVPLPPPAFTRCEQCLANDGREQSLANDTTRNREQSLANDSRK